MNAISRTLSLLVLPLLLSGCWWVALGGAAATGVYVARDDRDAGQIARDANITRRVKSKLIWDDYIKASSINVDTRNDHVTLHGNVPNPKVEEHAVLLATSVKNVTGVTSKLVVVPANPY